MSNFYLGVETADEEKKLNATYIISVARKLGCSIFLLPEDIIEVEYSELFSALSLYSHLSRSLFEPRSLEF